MSMRINKYLASSGLCSRRDADKLVQDGVVCIDGRIANSGDQVEDDQVVTVRGKELKRNTQSGHIVLAYYKPVGVTCTERDPHASRTVFDDVKVDRRVMYAGRLDKDSEGLLLLTDDGELIDAMMRGINGHEKEYLVKVNKELKEADLEAFRRGISLKELEVKTRPCDVEKIGKYTMRMILTQGLNRQIRRMCQEKGYKVVTLKRTRVMNVFLADLKPGESKLLPQKEVEKLYQNCGLTL